MGVAYDDPHSGTDDRGPRRLDRQQLPERGFFASAAPAPDVAWVEIALRPRGEAHLRLPRVPLMESAPHAELETRY